MKFQEYPVKVPKEKVYGPKIDKITSEFVEANDAETAAKALKKMFKLQDELASYSTIISVRNTIDTRDEKYDKAVKTMNKEFPLIQEHSNKFEKVLVVSKFKAELEKKFGTTIFKMVETSLKCFDPKIIPDLQKEGDLVLEYEKIMASAKLEFKGEVLNLSQIGKYLSDSDRETRIEAAKKYYGFLEENDAKIGQIYSDLIAVRTHMAKELGYESYTKLGYMRLGRLDYNSTMVEGYREQIKEVVVPQVAKLRKRQAKRLGIKKPIFLDYNVQFLSGNAKPAGNTDYLVEQAKTMYHAMSEESGKFFDFMIDNGLMDLDAKPGKANGGYMTYIPKYHAPFIFSNSNGTSQDVDTLTHEVGHAFQGYLASGIKVPNYRSPTLEACEIDSMSMEFFAYPRMNLFFKDQADKYRFAHLSEAISFLPYGVEVDDFQHRVYAHPTATHEERCAYWAEIDKIYRPRMDYTGFPYLESGHIWMRQSHIFATAFYYIDYTLAQVLALQFKCEMDKDRAKAWKKYIRLLKLGGKYPFVELLEKAHLRNPFIDGNVKRVVMPQMKILNSIDDSKF
jgi:M3 family oligoendopeptidase